MSEEEDTGKKREADLDWVTAVSSGLANQREPWQKKGRDRAVDEREL